MRGKQEARAYEVPCVLHLDTSLKVMTKCSVQPYLHGWNIPQVGLDSQPTACSLVCGLGVQEIAEAASLAGGGCQRNSHLARAFAEKRAADRHSWGA